MTWKNAWLEAASCASAALLLVACLGSGGGPDRDAGGPNGDGDGDGDGPNGPAWRAAFDTTDTGALYGVWGSGPDDVFIVGGTDTTAEAYHYDGSEWTPMDVTAPGALIWVTGFGPDDVYAVGLGGGVVHYDGQAWSALDSGVEDNLWGIFGFDDSELWIVGGDTEEGEPVMLRYDGQAFEPVALDPEENSRNANALFKVWGIDGAVFAVGQRGQIFEYRGGEWRNSPGGAQANQDFVSLWGTSRDNLVMVGGRSNAHIATYDGRAWTTRGESGVGGLNGVHMVRPQEAIVVGVRGFVGRYDLAEDTLTAESQDETVIDMHAVWGDGAGRHYAVAGEFLPPFRGAALVRELE